jgi:peptidoglycan/LPS O-acetylase OafA/YrhL
VDRPPPVDTATLRGARAVAVVCALAFLAPVALSLAFPAAFFYAPYHRAYERMIGALLTSFSVGLLLVLRDPARNAGVFAIVGLATGSLAGANVYALLVDGADPLHWWVQVPLLLAIAVALVVTYTRLRRPHPVVVRIVVAAVALMPAALFLYDVAYRSFVR